MASTSEPHQVSEPLSEMEYYRKLQQLEAENASLRKEMKQFHNECLEACYNKDVRYDMDIGRFKSVLTRVLLGFAALGDGDVAPDLPWAVEDGYQLLREFKEGDHGSEGSDPPQGVGGEGEEPVRP